MVLLHRRNKELCGALTQVVRTGEVGDTQWAGLRMASGGITCLDLTQMGDLGDRNLTMKLQ